METKSEYGCVLRINTGEIHPNIVTEMTGVESTMLQIKGTPRIDKKTKQEITGTSYVENMWMFDPNKCYGSEWDIENAIQKVLDIISLYDGFNKVFSKFEESILLCYAYVYHYNISFILSPQIIGKLQNIGIPIEFDLYSMEE